jgi:hypothetical protein
LKPRTEEEESLSVDIEEGGGRIEEEGEERREKIEEAPEKR